MESGVLMKIKRLAGILTEEKMAEGWWSRLGAGSFSAIASDGRNAAGGKERLGKAVFWKMRG